MNNPFDPTPALAPKQQGMSARDKALVGAITDAMMKHHVRPLADRVAALETLLAKEQAAVSDAIRTAVTGFLDGTAPSTADDLERMAEQQRKDLAGVEFKSRRTGNDT
ncbi:hypothetical protein [Falsiruegeria mediterranea]